MKKTLLALIAISMSLTVSAQRLSPGSLTLTPRLGLNASGYEGDDNEDLSYKVGFTCGAELEYYIKNWLGISGGLVYSMQGCSVDDTDYNINSDYINIPCLVNFHVGDHFTLKTGLQPGINLNTKVSGDGVSVDMSKSGLDNKSFDLAIPVGVCYNINNFVIDARYQLGVIKAFNNNTSEFGGDPETYNSTFSLTIGYCFQLK